MKTLILALLLVGTSVFAQRDDYTVENLDKMKTCQTEKQKETALKALTWLENFKWWQVKNQLDSVHPDFMVWHSAWAFAYNHTIEGDRGKFPFKYGQVSKDEYLKALAYIAYTNLVSKYTIDLHRLDCVGRDSVVFSTVFNSVSILRDPKGYVRYAVPLENAATRVLMDFKAVREVSEQKSAQKEVSEKCKQRYGKDATLDDCEETFLYRAYFDLSDSISVDIAKKLGELVKTGNPNYPEEDATRATFGELLEKFEEEAK